MMTSILGQLSYRIYLFLINSTFGRVFAANATPSSVNVGIPIPTEPGKTGATSYTSWAAYLSDIYKFALYIGTALAVLMIVWSGFLYITSQGDTGKISTAKEFTLGALIGLALLYMVNFLAQVLSVNPLPTP